MALIDCPECGKKISSQTEKCINCGYPIALSSHSDKANVAAPETESTQSHKLQQVGLGLCIIGGVIIGLTEQLAYFIYGPFMFGASTADMPAEAKVRNFGILIIVIGGVILIKSILDQKARTSNI